jgi:phosphohistidine phosphatase SixA
MSRTLVLLHHGDSTENGLYPSGVQEVRWVADQLVKTGFQPDIILTPKARQCVETAEIVSEAYAAAGKNVELRVKEPLHWKSVANTLTNLTVQKNVLIVEDSLRIENALMDFTPFRIPLLTPASGEAIFISSERRDWASVVRTDTNKIIRTIDPSRADNLRL